MAKTGVVIEIGIGAAGAGVTGTTDVPSSEITVIHWPELTLSEIFAFKPETNPTADGEEIES